MEIKITREFPFIPMRRYFMAFSTLLTIVLCFAIWKIGINYGVDFLGGEKLTIKVQTPDMTEGRILKLLEEAGLTPSVQRLGEPAEQRFLVRLGHPIDSAEAPTTNTAKQQSAPDQVLQTLQKAFGAEAVSLEAQESVGPRVGKELKLKGEKAIVFTLLALLIYIGFRFDFYFAPGAIVALVHDVVITLGAIVIARCEYDLTMLAALLTIVGYSNNDTIIIYDRIREHAKEITPENIEKVVNRAINEMLSRAIVTHLTVLFVVLILYFTTQGVIKNFAFAFIFGVIAGAYSSIFIASPIYIWLYRRFPQWRKA